MTLKDRAIKLLIGGSPCTKWSIAQTKNREVLPEGMGWELFENYRMAKEKFQPDFFLYENNKSAAQPIKDAIYSALGGGKDSSVRLTHINSALVSAQNRERFYVTNFGDIEQPKDRGILLRDVLEDGGITDRDKSRAMLSSIGRTTTREYFSRSQNTMVYESVKLEGGVPMEAFSCADGKSYTVYEVIDGQITIKDGRYPVKLTDGYYIIRKLTPIECERLQTLPDGYTTAVSNTQRYKALGNGWTAEVIIYLLNHALKDVPRDKELVVLSMYDGIATGRYCLDKMGFSNIKYYAYEIDPYPIKIAMSNYPDIIQCGDAFQVREDGWKISI